MNNMRTSRRMETKEEPIPMGQADGTAAPVDQGTASGETGRERVAIVIAGRDGREMLGRELSRRYGADYQIVVCDKPAELASRVRELLRAGTPVALVIGAVGEADPDGIEVLAQIRDVDPTVSRVAAVRWGAWDTARPIFDAITMGKLDHWVLRTVQSPDEEFHRSITQFLGEWQGERDGGFEAVQLIGDRWSARSQELRTPSPGTASRSASTTPTPKAAASCCASSGSTQQNCPS